MIHTLVSGTLHSFIDDDKKAHINSYTQRIQRRKEEREPNKNKKINLKC